VATLQDTIKILIQADGAKAVQEFEKVGATAQRELDRTGKATRDWSAQLTRTGAGLVGFAAVSSVALYKTAQSASDLAETVSKTNVVFDESAAKVIAFGDGAAESIGQSKQAALDAASTFGGLAKGIGLSSDESADFSIKLTTLASDLASFGNTSPEEAVLALGSALRGESEPIRKYNVLLNEAAIKGEAYASGIAKQGEELTEQQKVQARYNVILKQTGDAQGDFARTADGAANQQRILSAQFKDLQANVGTGLLPIFTKLVSTANDVVGVFSDMSPKAQSVVGSIAGIATVGSGVVGSLLLIAGQAAKARDALTTLGADGSRSLNGLGKAAAGIGGVVTALAVLGEVYSNLGQERVNIDRLKVSVDELARGQVFGVLSEKLGVGDDFSANVAQNIRDLNDLDKEISGVQRVGLRALQTIADPFPSGQGGATEFTRLQNLYADLDDQLAQLAQSGNAKAAADAFGRIARAAVEGGASLEDVYRVFPDYTGIARGLDDAAEAQDENTRSIDKHVKSVGQLNQAYDEFYDRVLGRRDTVRDAAAAQLDVADSLAAISTAQARLTELQQSGTASAEEIAAAQRDVARATLDYSGSVDDAVAAIRDATAIQAGYELGTKNSEKETRNYIAALKAQRDQLSGPLRDALTEYIRGINKIPAEKNTKVKVDTADAKRDLDTFIENYSASTITITASVNVPQITGLGGFAAGGPVRGNVPIIVGEQGPEVFVPNSSGSIVPNHALGGAGGSAFGRTGDVIVVNFHGPVAGSQRAMERMMVDALKSARRRGDRDVA
jgi:hypothetical protein